MAETKWDVVVKVALSSEPLDICALQEMVMDPLLGGIVTFTGAVRALTGELQTDRLFYEAHEAMALAQMKLIAEEEAAQFGANVALAHRLGDLQPGETAVVCVAACAHRAAAFDCCRNLIERIKQDVPIWKKEFGPSGAEWK